MISILIPTIEARDERCKRTVEQFERIGGDLEFCIERDDASSNWGTKIAKCAERATGDYLFCCADDLDVHMGWWEAAVAVCDSGHMPAPCVFNPDGSIQSAGETWGEDSPEGTVVGWSRFPFLSRVQWERFGPTLPIHYSDRILGIRGKKAGVDCKVTHGFALTHHYAPEGRKDNDIEYMRARVAEKLDADGADVWELVNRGLETAVEVVGLLPWKSDEIYWRACHLVHASNFAESGDYAAADQAMLGSQASPGPTSGRGEETP